MYDQTMPSTGNIGHKHPFVKTIGLALRDRCDIEPGSRLILAVSGGADSVAMLRAIALIAPRKHWQLRLSVGHVQHHLRDDAEEDAGFVESLAAAFDLPYLRRDLDLQAATGNVEDAARKARYAALLSMAEEAKACAIATAHHGDDQLETLLMRLLRGASVSGLRGIAWRRDVDQNHATGSDTDTAKAIIRPMLGVDRCDIIQFLHELDQDWREDHTNADLAKVRAKLRADVLPHLQDLSPHFAERLVTMMDHFSDVTDLIDETTDSARRFVDESDPDRSVFPREQARQMPAVVLTELLRRLCLRAGVGADALGNRTLRPVIRMIHDHEGGRRIVELQQEVTIEITRNDVSVLHSKQF